MLQADVRVLNDHLFGPDQVGPKQALVGVPRVVVADGQVLHYELQRRLSLGLTSQCSL